MPRPLTPRTVTSSHLAQIWRDLGVIVTIVLAFFGLAAYFELSERVAVFALRYEYLQADELTLTLLLLSVCLAWFAFRRACEARDALAERIQAQDKIRELLAHNRDLAQRLILVQESERRALARELHDEVGQNCMAIRAEASFILHSHADSLVGPNTTVAASAKRIDVAAGTLYAMVRDMLKRLRPPALDSLGLEAALQELCETWEGQTGVACGFFPRGVPTDVDDSTSIAIFRLVQETLTNVTRHARASQVNIILQPATAPGRLSLTVQDDGQGMAQPDGPHAGFGLIGMRERVAALQGSIVFSSAANSDESGSESGGGLLITVELPWVASAP